jgi:glycosyltransferase involved in cell wall biosynthesis
MPDQPRSGLSMILVESRVKMKVSHLTSVHPTEDIRIFIKECKSLAAAGYDVSLITANKGSYEVDGVKIIGLDVKAPSRVSRMINATKAVYRKALEINSDVYHFHDPELLWVGLMLKKKGKKVVYDVHEDVPEQVLSKQWIPKPLRKIVSFFVTKIESYCSSRFDAVVTATPHISNRFKTYNKNTVTIHNFPILNELLNNVPEVKDVTFNNFIYVGGLTGLRGTKEMVQAIGVLNKEKKSELVLGGAFSPPALHEEVRREEGWKHTDYKGYLTRAEVKKELAEATGGLVLIHPEPRYVVSYPIKLFEYMSAGIPAIASNFPLWKEIVEKNKCGICVDPLNPEDIASAMKWLIDNPEEAKLMGENGRKAVIEKYNWEHESKELVSLYSRMKS